MTQHAAISVLGKDRPGIVAAITKALFETGCNIEDSSMTLLRSEFAMILIVELPERLTLDQLGHRISDVERDMELSITLRPLTSLEEEKEAVNGEPLLLSVYGADKPGIVYGISSFLAKNNVNITDVQTSVSGSGKDTVYIMLLEVIVPESTAIPEFQNALNQAASSLKVTITVNQIESASF